MTPFQQQLMTREFREQMGTDRRVEFDTNPELVPPALWILTGERDEPGENRFFVATLEIKEALPMDQLASDFGWYLDGRGAPAGHATNPLTGQKVFVGSDMEAVT